MFGVIELVIACCYLRRWLSFIIISIISLCADMEIDVVADIGLLLVIDVMIARFVSMTYIWEMIAIVY